LKAAQVALDHADRRDVEAEGASLGEALCRAAVKAMHQPTLAYALEFLTYVTACPVVGVVTAWRIEVPVLAVRDRWFPSRGTALELAPETRARGGPAAAVVEAGSRGR
jgi:hypothetical protein